MKNLPNGISAHSIHFGTRQSLLIGNLTGTPVGSRKLSTLRLHPNNINRDSGNEIPEQWIPTIKKHNRRTVQQRTTEGVTSRRYIEDRNAPITADHRDKWCRVASRRHRLMKTSSKQSNRRDLHLKK